MRSLWVKLVSAFAWRDPAGGRAQLCGRSSTADIRPIGVGKEPALVYGRLSRKIPRPDYQDGDTAHQRETFGNTVGRLVPNFPGSTAEHLETCWDEEHSGESNVKK